jgi:GNAT superfamily N-acetyltransferase
MLNFDTVKTACTFTNRPLTTDQDYWRVRNLLIQTYPITPFGFNWEIRRWEGRRFHDNHPDQLGNWAKNVQLWETETGELIAAVHPEGAGDAHFQLHPDYRHLEPTLLTWAEEHLAVGGENGRQLELFVYDYDVYRQHLLRERGYKQLEHGGVTRHLRLGKQPLAQPQLAAGYTLRTTNPDDLADCQHIADILNAAFNRDVHTGREYQNLALNAPCFRRELDLVAVAPDGSFAAYAGIPYDEANKLGIFEPVCTHPDHQRKGLGKALMQEGLLRLKAIGAVDVTVGTGDMIPANRLYDSLGFTEAYKGDIWQKIF